MSDRYSFVADSLLSDLRACGDQDLRAHIAMHVRGVLEDTIPEMATSLRAMSDEARCSLSARFLALENVLRAVGRGAGLDAPSVESACEGVADEGFMAELRECGDEDLRTDLRRQVYGLCEDTMVELATFVAAMSDVARREYAFRLIELEHAVRSLGRQVGADLARCLCVVGEVMCGGQRAADMDAAPRAWAEAYATCDGIDLAAECGVTK